MEKEYLGFLKCNILSKVSYTQMTMKTQLFSGAWVSHGSGDRQVDQKTEILFEFLKAKKRILIKMHQ